MESEPVVIRGRPGEPDLYFTTERVVTGLVHLLARGHLDEAVEVYRRCHPSPTGALCGAVAGSPELLREAGNLFFRVGDLATAAACCEQGGEHAKAGLLYERTGRAADAARAWRSAGDDARAAACLARAGGAEECEEGGADV